ncbi:4Fe-4S binding protein [Methanocalculus sp. MSAO_Arc2]|uniref:4Fe-4S binding protein n=1 Tax=Methanocalculus sp. MSAO_Arc2 TaxID=2293855 RepID=UPI003217A10D
MRSVLRSWCDSHEIPLLGIADAGRYNNPDYEHLVPLMYRPEAIIPGTRSVIVIGLPVHLPAIDSSPSILYRESYRTVNTLLDQYTYRIANLLNGMGFPSVPIPRDGYGSIEVLLKKPVTFFSHRHAAYFAGLGTFGINNMLLTPEFGPRVRFGSVFSSLEVEPDQVMATDLCTRCMECQKHCPVGAVSSEDYPKGKTSTMACAKYSAALNKRYASPCGICIKVCPVGSDRSLYGREDTGVYREMTADPVLWSAWEHIRSHGSL